MSSSIFCSLSGSPIVEGVIDKNTGFIYEKSTILCHLKTYGTCPHTNASIKQSDLIPIITGNNTSFLTGAKSVTEIVENLTNEYDSLILDAYSNKEQLQTVRQQLAVSLYQQDASLRVIAKLKQQITSKKQQVVKLIEANRLKNVQNA